MNSTEIIPELATLLGIDPTQVTFLRYSQNRVYEVSAGEGHSHILRLTANSHRTREEIQGELDWLKDLHQSGLSVCPPRAHGDGALIQTVQISERRFHAVMFEKAAGLPLMRNDLTPRLYELHGRSLGRLHALSRTSHPGSLTARRKWNEERYFTTDIPVYLPEESRVAVLAHFHALRAGLNALPVIPENFGPCHLDLGYANFFLNGDRLEIFDFDNSTLCYFAADIAAALYGSIFNGLRCEFPGDRSCFEHPKSSQILEQVWTPFREGYLSESPWPEVWNEQIPLWFQVMYLRAVVHAFRIQHPITNPKVQTALDADIDNVLMGRMPIRLEFLKGVTEV